MYFRKSAPSSERAAWCSVWSCLVVSVRMHLTSNAICATGRQFVDWTADDRVCSRSPWDPHGWFDPIFDHLPQLLASPEAPVLMALDDTMCKKSSPHIPGASMGRDPMSPAFHVNLCYGLRLVQASILVTSKPEAGAARALPVRFDFAPPAKKPRPNKPNKSDTETSGQPENRVPSDASSGSPAKETLPSSPADAESAKQKQEWEAKLEAYKKEKKQRRLPLAGLHAIRSVRESLNQRSETRHRTRIATGDGSYTTRDVVRNLPQPTNLSDAHGGMEPRLLRRNKSCATSRWRRSRCDALPPASFTTFR
jgi:hypothetical protein